MSFYNDTFTSASAMDLKLHTSNDGATYSLHPSWNGGQALIVANANRVRSNSAAGTLYEISHTAATADAWLAADFVVETLVSTNAESQPMKRPRRSSQLSSRAGGCCK